MIRQVLFILSIIFIMLVAGYFIMNLKEISSLIGKKSRTDVIRNAYSESVLNKSPVKVTLAKGKVLATVALTSQERADGLMYRDFMAENEGMLFVFPSSQKHTFWMKNTMIPLDIIWLDSSFKVVHIEKTVPPCKQKSCPSYGPSKKAKYVLEVNSGWVDNNEVNIGDQAKVD